MVENSIATLRAARVPMSRKTDRSLAVVSIAALVAFASGCGGGRNPDLEAAAAIPESQRVGSLKAEILLGAETLTFRDGGVEGRGTFRFADILPRWDSANNFVARLQLEEGESITLLLNATRPLQSGVEIEIARPIGAASPAVTIKAGADRLVASPSFADVDVSREFGLSFDVHNNEPSLHLLVWRDGVAEPILSDIVNGRGRGAFWGARLDGGRLRSAARLEPRDAH